jgi:hypothetical protein
MDDTKPNAWRCNGANLYVGEQIQDPCPPGWVNLKFETLEYGHESRGIRTKGILRWRGPASDVS